MRDNSPQVYEMNDGIVTEGWSLSALKVPTATEAAEKIELWTELLGHNH